MLHGISRMTWIAAVAALLASPIVVMLLVPEVIGAGLHVADLHSERSLVLLLWGPVGLVLLRRVARRIPSRQSVAA